MNLSNFKKLFINGVEMKELFMNGTENSPCIFLFFAKNDYENLFIDKNIFI